MNDPIKPVIDQIADSAEFCQARSQNLLTSSFLNNVAEVFEIYGFSTTRLYLRDKSARQEAPRAAQVLLAVLDCMDTCPAIHQNRAIGRTIIKTLNSLPIPAGNPPHQGERTWSSTRPTR